jgi:hypothetical protein
MLLTYFLREYLFRILAGKRRLFKLIFRCVRKIGKSDCWLRHVCPSVRLSTWNNSAPTGRIFMKIEIHVFLENLEKMQVSLKMTSITGTLHEDKYMFLITSCSVLLRMKNVSDKICRENQNTHFIFNIFFLNFCLNVIMWKIL